MPSKKSKISRTPVPRRSPSRKPRNPLKSVWKDELACSEADLASLARKLATELRPGDRVLLEGEMGAGKSTLAREILLALGVSQPPEGSPTFAIAHEYELDRRSGRAIHIDLYRIASEDEIEARGIPEYFWDPEAVVLCEWTSLWKDFERSVLSSGKNWKIDLKIADENRRKIRVRPPRA